MSRRLFLYSVFFLQPGHGGTAAPQCGARNGSPASCRGDYAPSLLQVSRHAKLKGMWDAPIHKTGAVPLPHADVELVVASHCEPSEWMMSHDGPITVYNKGDCHAKLSTELSGHKHARVVDLQNTGREGETYLRHIIDNYDALSPYTVFAQGAGEHNGVKVMDKVQEFIELGNSTVPVIPIVHRNDKGIILYRDKDPDETVVLNLDGLDENNVYLFDYGNVPVADKARALYMTMFGGTACEAPPMVFSAGAQFIVSRDAIRSRPRAFYEHLLRGLDNAKCAELGYVLERLWLFIFDPSIKTPAEQREFPDYCAWQATQARLTEGRGDCKEYRKQDGVWRFTDMM